ncbi:glycosyltransferase [Oxyplasma meridianum]|uniref:Glycosyltransferase n=1 Tax=Oxyplasma meridianum TaxID=3073602 RepID=A0AAX4NFI4_9ARCH
MVTNRKEIKLSCFYWSLKEDLTLVVPSIKGSSGTKSYAENTIRGLSSLNVDYRTISVRKIELSFRGKPYFGIFFQYLQSTTKKGQTKVVHALSPDVVIKGTDIVTIHDIIPFLNPEIYMKSLYDKMAYRLSFGRALQVKTLLLSTETGKGTFLDRTGIDNSRVKVVHHSIDHEKFFPERFNPYEESNKVKVISVSDFNPRKRIDVLIDALGGDKEIDLYHIGPKQGWSSRFEELSRKAKNYENVKLLGPMDSKKLREYLTFADLFVYLSDNEGFGLPPIEAMACGTNVVVNDLPVFKETLDDQAYFCKIDDFGRDVVMNAIKKRKDPKQLIRFSMRYSIENHARNLLEVYKNTS